VLPPAAGHHLITLGQPSVGVGYGTLTHARHCVEIYATKEGHELTRLYRHATHTTNSSVDEIGERCRLNHAIAVYITLPPLYTISP